MNDLSYSISEDELGILSFEVLDYADRISEIFNKLDLCIEQLSLQYQGQACVEIVNHYKQLKQSFPVIKRNLRTYSDDFIKLIQRMQESDTYLAGLLQDKTEETRKKTESIKNENIDRR